MRVELTGPADAKIMLVGESPGELGDKLGKPFMGNIGQVLDRLLDQAGVSRHDCLLTNVAKERPPGNKISFFFEDSKCTIPKEILKSWIEELKNEIIKYEPNIVVALGATALWALTGRKGIKEYRGYVTECSLVPGVKVLPTYHPMAVDAEKNLAFETVMDLRKAVKNSDSPGMPKETRRLITNMSLREYMDYLEYLLQDHKAPIAVDIETVSPGSHIDVMGIAESPNKAVSFSIVSNRIPKFSVEKEIQLWRMIAQVLETKDVIMQNGKYDATVLMHHHGIFCERYFFDTHIAAHCCWPETPRSLGFLSSICLNIPAWKHTSGSNPLMYNAGDCANTYGCYEILNEEIDKQGVRETFLEEMMQIYPAAMLEMQGIYFNKEKQRELIVDSNSKLKTICAALSTAFNKSVVFKAPDKKFKGINLGSPVQLNNLLYNSLGLPEQFARRKSASDTRKLTSDKDALEKLTRITKNPVLELIIEGKKINKLLTSFVDITVSPLSRVHTCYNVTGATSIRTQKDLLIDDEGNYKSFGRWSSSMSIIFPWGSGNLQNVPYEARKLYTAPDGYEYVQADYMQAEAVVVAYLIGDSKLQRMFSESFGLSREERKRRNLDVHKITAADLYGVENYFEEDENGDLCCIFSREILKEERVVGKTIRHATNYSAGPLVIVHRLGCEMREAKKLLNTFASKTPQLHVYHMRVQRELKTTRTLYNLFGRKHKFLERMDDTLFRSAYAYKPQSTVGDLMNRSLVKFYYRYGKEIPIVLQLHDAIYVLSPLDQRANTIEKLRECMLYELEVNGETFTIDVDFSAGPSWGELEEL